MEPKNINGSSRIYEHDIIGWFEDISEKAGQVQTETLRRILELNWGVEYLKKWFGNINIQDMDATALEYLYTSLVPLSSHADLEPYISRIADGDTAPLLTRQPIKLLSLSSGTTEGRQKLVPFTDHSARTTLQIFSLAAAYRSRVYPTREGGRILEFIYSSKQFKTKGSNPIEDEPVPLSKVKEGQEYDIVLTTFTGLYRCKLGDVVEVTGFHNGTPKLNFICRRKLILTINIDKNTEKDLQMVVEKGSELLVSKARAELVDFTSHAELETQPGHYIIYWEIKGDVGEDVLGECCRKMDASFVDHGYVVSRSTNSIGPLELCIVKIGTFKKILEYFIGNGAALSQFKTPRCTSNHGLLKILSGSTIKRIYSTAYS